MSHGQQFRLALSLVALVVIFGVVGHFDYADQLEQERADKREVAEQLRQERSARMLPNTVFILEARTAEQAQVRLAEIASDLDVQRLKLKGAK